MTKLYILVWCLFTYNLSNINGSKILGVFPTPSLSHQVVFRPIMQALVERGHEVYVMTPNPMYTKTKAPTNYTEIDVQELSYTVWIEFLQTVDMQPDNALGLIKLAGINLLKLYEKQINTKEMQSILNGDINFDLAIIETTFRSTNAIGHKLKVPIIQISSLGSIFVTNEIFGIPNHLFIYPQYYEKKISNFCLWEKIKILYDYINLRLYFSYELYPLEKEVLQRNFGPNAPTIEEIDKSLDMLFVNLNPIWDFNRPIPPNVIYLGGLHQKPESQLPEDLKSYLDSSKHGIIYMSFGTNVDPTLLPIEKINIFCKVFSKLPYDVLWKWNGDHLSCKPDNVKISKWLPQSDLLRHPKIKVFITQAGLQSTDESITAGVPLIAFPMLGDQWYNAEKYIQHKIGLKMDFETVNEKNLEEAIKTVIEDSSYRQNIIKLRSIMNDQPQSPLERAVWWTEYVLRHGGARHLRAHMADVTWTQYLMLDVVAVLLSITLLILFVVYVTVKLVLNVIFVSSSTSKLKKS